MQTAGQMGGVGEVSKGEAGEYFNQYLAGEMLDDVHDAEIESEQGHRGDLQP